MKFNMKQNNFVQSSYSLFILSVIIFIFYSIYGLGPFTDMQLKIRKREEMLKTSLIKEQTTLTINWAEGGPEHHFWKNTTGCQDYKTKFAKVNTLPTQALVSYPGSGNTWIRYLIEGATGLYTGSIFNDRSILRAGHYGEGRDYKDGSTILQKTHHRSLYVERYKDYGLKWREDHIQTFQGKAVLVIRNPYKAILSYWNFFNTKSHTSVIGENSFESLKFKDFVFTGASRWFELIDDWTRMGSEVYYIFYEELAEDPVKEMRQLMEFLGLPVDEGRLSCISQHLSGSFKRTVHQEKDPFSSDHHMMIKTVIEKANKMIEYKTGRRLPTNSYEYYVQ